MGGKKVYTVEGFTGCITELAVHFNKKVSSIYGYLKKGESIEDAIEHATACLPGQDPRSMRREDVVYTVDGFTGNIGELAIHFGINPSTLSGRLHKGLSIEDAVKPVYRAPEGTIHKQHRKSTRKVYTVHGFTGNMTEISQHFGINSSTLYSRIHRGDSLEQAVSYSVNKEHSVKLPTIKAVGKYRGPLVDVISRFGIAGQTSTISNDDLEDVIRRPEFVRFYTVDGYRGTLKAISDKFNISYTNLIKGAKLGISVEEMIHCEDLEELLC